MPTDDHRLVTEGGSQDSGVKPAAGRSDGCQWGDPDASKAPQPADQVIVLHDRKVTKAANLLEHCPRQKHGLISVWFGQQGGSQIRSVLDETKRRRHGVEGKSERSCHDIFCSKHISDLIRPAEG